MKTCPKCGELNGESRAECFKCHSALPIDNYKKICPKCGVIYSAKAETCEKCGLRLSVYSDRTPQASSGSDSGCILYVVSALLPFIGIILGCIYIARREDELGKSLLFTSIVSSIIFIVLAILLQSCGIY